MSILCSHFVSGNDEKAKKDLFNILDQKYLTLNYLFTYIDKKILKHIKKYNFND